MTKIILRIVAHKSFPILTLILIISSVYYKFFVFGKIPFPGDLLIGSYFPWLDYYKMPVQNPLISDVFSQLILWKYMAIDSFKAGQWPLWNPYSFMGTPLLANYQSAVLYPINVLLLLPKYFGWGLYIYSQTLIASLTFYLFISQIVKSKIARLTGAIIFSLGGLMTTWLELGTFVHAMAWLPLAMYSLRKFILIKKFRFMLLLIISLSLTILSGNAQITTYSFIIVMLYSSWLLRKKYSLMTLLIFFSLLISISLTSLQLLPSFDLLQNSIRRTESYTAKSNFGLLEIKDILKFFIPDYFGNEVTRNYWGSLNYAETNGFLGILTLPLLIYALFKLRSKDGYFFSLLLLLGLIFTFNNPISSTFYNLKIPLLTSSYASRMLFIILLSSSIITSLSIDQLWKNKDFNFIQKIILWSWFAILGVIIGTLLTYYYVWNALKSAPNELYFKIYSSSNDYALQNFLIAIKNSLIPLAFLSVILIVSLILNLKLSFFKKYRLKILLIIIFIISILDLGRYFLKYNPFVSNNFIFPETPALEFLQKQKGLFRVGREHAEVLPPNTWIAYNLQSYEGYDPIYLNDYGKFMHFLNGGDIRDGTSTRYAELTSNYDSSYLDSANAKYFIAILRDKEGRIPGDLLDYRFQETNFKLVFKNRSSAILENPNAKERIYFAKNIITFPAKKIADIFMEDKNFDPRKTIALSENINISRITGEGDAIISYYSPNKVVIETQTTSDEVLILADQYENGWEARIDGNITKISPANLIFRAIKVPTGKHEVVFNYFPKSFENGLRISTITILFLLIGTLVISRAKKF